MIMPSDESSFLPVDEVDRGWKIWSEDLGIPELILK